MRVRVHDPSGPLALRWGLTLLGLGLLVGGAFLTASVWSWALFVVGTVVLFPSRALTERFRPRMGEVHLEPGAVTIEGTFPLDQRIDTRPLLGAFAARSAHGATVVLARGSASRAPIVLEVATERDALAILASLGVGRAGFGRVAWELGGGALDTTYLGAQLAAGTFWLAFAVASWIAPGNTPSTLAGLAFLAALAATAFALGLALVRRVVARPTLTISPGGVTIRRDAGRTELPFPSIVRVIRQRGALTFATSRPELATLVRCRQVRFSAHAPTDEEQVILVEQIEGALDRAREPPAPHVSASSRLGRAEGESARGWLARLEVLAGGLLRTDAYRRSEIDEATLWSVVEDHDGDPATRAAAARVLVRVAPEPSRARIAEVFATVREDRDRALFRVALEPDLDTAAAELEAIERPGGGAGSGLAD